MPDHLTSAASLAHRSLLRRSFLLLFVKIKALDYAAVVSSLALNF